MTPETLSLLVQVNAAMGRLQAVRRRKHAKGLARRGNQCRDERGRWSSCGGTSQSGKSHAERKARRKAAGKHKHQARKRAAGAMSERQSALHKRHTRERRTLGRALRKDRRKLAAQHAKESAAVARDLRAERHDLHASQRTERRRMGKHQRRQIAAHESRHAERMNALKERHAEAEATRPRLAERHAERQQEHADRHAENLATLRERHQERRQQLLAEQRESRSDQRTEHRRQIREHRQSHADERNEEAADARFGAADQRLGHRLDVTDAHYSDRQDHGKAVARFVTKAIDAPVPSAADILTEALEEYGFTEAWNNGTLSDRDAIDVLNEIRLIGRAWLRAEAEELVAEFGVETKGLVGDTARKVKGFFGRASKFVKELFVAGALVLGGPGPLTSVEIEAVNKSHAAQADYLANFERQVLEEERRIDPTFAARAEQYGASVYGAGLEANRQLAIRGRIFTEERRVLGVAEHCDDCPPLAALGWQPIGTLPPIGESECRIFCRCRFEYRGPDGVEHMVARRRAA